MHWVSAQGADVSQPFYVPTGARTCMTYASTNVPQSVLNRATATSTVSVPANIEIDEVNAYVNVTHPYIGDLAVALVSPSGTSVLLHDHPGGSVDNVVGWFDTDRPSFDPLARFNGEPTTGTWTLRVTDSVPSNTGTLNAWSLQVCGRPFEARPPEILVRSATKSPGRSRSIGGRTPA